MAPFKQIVPNKGAAVANGFSERALSRNWRTLLCVPPFGRSSLAPWWITAINRAVKTQFGPSRRAACGKSGGLSSDLYFTRCVTFYDFILYCVLSTRVFGLVPALFPCLIVCADPMSLDGYLSRSAHLFAKSTKLRNLRRERAEKKWLWGDAEIYRRISRRAKWSKMMMVFALVRAKWLWRVCCGSDAP